MIGGRNQGYRNSRRMAINRLVQQLCKEEDMLFADDAAVVAHTQDDLQSLMDCFSQACKDFGLTISLKKTNVLGQDTEAPPVITIDDYELDAVCQFTYLGSTITDNLWTQISTRGLGRQLQLSPISRLECGQAPSCLSRQRWQSTMPV